MYPGISGESIAKTPTICPSIVIGLTVVGGLE